MVRLTDASRPHYGSVVSTSQHRAAEEAVVAAAARWRAAQASERTTRAHLAQRVAAWQEAGATQRAIARRIGLRHPYIRRLIEEAPEPPTDPGRQLVPTLTATQFLNSYAEAFGEVAEVLVSFNDGDTLLESGRHPEAFASEGSHLSVPNLLLINADGDMVGIEDCNCGYGGTGPSNTVWFLRQLDWPAEQHDLVFRCRFLRLRRDEVLRQEPQPVSYIDYRMMEFDGDDDGINVLVDRPSRRWRFDASIRDENGEGNLAGDWIRAVFNAKPRFPWADGPRVARCYLSYDAIRDAGLSRSSHGLRGPENVTVILEQGDTQLWCQTSLPLDWTEYLSDDTYQLLEEFDVYPAQLRDAEPRTWFQKMMARRAARPPFVDISKEGNLSLRREPKGLSEHL